MLKLVKLNGLEEATHFLRGGILGGRVPHAGVPLAGKTLTFDSPAFTCTFAAVVSTTRDGNYLLYPDIKNQVEAANADIRVTSFSGVIGFIKKTPTSAVKLAAAAPGTAHSLLGFGGDASQGMVVEKQGGASPTLEHLAVTVDNTVTLVIDE